MTSELKPCAHCGERGTIERNGPTIYYVECISCGCGTKYAYGSDKAVGQWNRRAPSEAVGLLREVERIFTTAHNDEEVGTLLTLSGTIDKIRRFLAAQEGT